MSNESPLFHPVRPLPRRPSPPAVLRVGLLGCGVVGSAVARILLEDAETVATAAGAKLEVVKVAVRDLFKQRPVRLPRGLLTTDAAAVVGDPTIDIIVEVIGGIDLPRELIAGALNQGKSVVTANKELIACSGRYLASIARDEQRDLFFEASVGGAIPILSALRNALAADSVKRIVGVVNGTTNFILNRMIGSRSDIDSALRDALQLGYAEQDPTADLKGVDAAAKVAILASLAFDGWVTAAHVPKKGISSVTVKDLRAAQALGYSIKLLAVAERLDKRATLRVGPALVSDDSALARLPDVMNAVLVECERAGPLVFQGRGAGGEPSASAVVGDVVAAARNLLDGRFTPLVAQRSSLWVSSSDRSWSRYFLRLDPGGRKYAEGKVVETIESTGVQVEARHSALGQAADVSVVTAPINPESLRVIDASAERAGFRIQSGFPVVEVEA